MRLQKILLPAGAVAAVALAYRFYGWAGVVAVATAGVMGLLLHFNRLMQVLKRAADRPIGQVDSAVMLNARLQPGMTLLHVLAMTRSLGQRQSEENSQPEVFRWSDAGNLHVTCTFVNGKLAEHALFRPAGQALPSTP